MGEVLADVDGYFKFWPDKERYGGYWDQGVLFELYRFLEEKNKPWDEEINKYFEDSRNS